jgi:ABC-type microcin C transport system permease subunit YejB
VFTQSCIFFTFINIFAKGTLPSETLFTMAFVGSNRVYTFSVYRACPVIFAFVDVFTALSYRVHMMARGTFTSVKTISILAYLRRLAFVGPSRTFVNV